MHALLDAYRDAVLRGDAKFDGRLGVGGYWRFVVVNVAVIVLLMLLTLVPGLAAGVRRLQDTGRPGVYILLAVVPCVSLVLLYILVQPGTPGDNTYGPAPTG